MNNQREVPGDRPGGTAGRKRPRRHRYLACQQVGIAPRFETLADETDPLAYVVSMNLKRRHLNESQRAMIVDKVATMQREDTLKQNRSANLQNGHVSRGTASTMLNVSERTVADAHKVRQHAIPDLIHAVDFDPPLYNVWKQQEKTPGVRHPGNSELRWRAHVGGWTPTSGRAYRRIQAGVGSRATGDAACGLWAPEWPARLADVGRWLRGGGHFSGRRNFDAPGSLQDARFPPPPLSP